MKRCDEFSLEPSIATRRAIAASRAPSRAAVLVSAVAALAGGCGAGAAAVASGSGGDGGGGNAPPVLSGFAVANPKTSPALVRFTLSDPEANSAEVTLLYSVDGGPAQPLTRIVSGIPSNPAKLAAPKAGADYEVEWDFAAESDLPDDAQFEPDVGVYATVAGGIQEIVPGTNAVELGLGNDPPAIAVEPPSAPEMSGIVAQRFHLSDSSSDNVSVRAEYDIQGDVPDDGWRIARPGGLASGAATPDYAFQSVEALPGGTELVFFWDTDHDLAEIERDVVLRFTAKDPVVEGARVATDPFRVDNNEEPIVLLGSDLFLANPDQRRGIPIPFRIVDEEEDEVDVVFQWRRSGESFPDLPQDPAAIRAILDDPEQRRQHRVCTEFPRRVEGRIVPVDSTTVELPELAGEAAHLVAQGIEGRELEILRASKLPRPVSQAWASNPLRSPVAALPLGDGLSVLVLDAPSGGSWRLLEVELASGEPACGSDPCAIATASGVPTAMALERGEASVLVASDESGSWRVERVELASGAVTELVARAASVAEGPIRGIASLGTGAALITLESSLVRLDWSGPRPRAVEVLRGLNDPWGVALDPLREGRVHVAEHGDPGRVVSIDLDTRSIEAVVALPSTPGEPALPRPRALALSRGGTRLFALCDVEPLSGRVELRGVDLGGGAGNAVFSLGGPLGRDARSLASGPDDLVLVARSAADELLAGGGLEQRRTIAEHEPNSRNVVVAEAFAPSLRPGQGWRVDLRDGRRAGAPDGRSDVFVWDSRDVFAGGEVHVRAVPLDTEIGQADANAAAKRVTSAIGAKSTDLPATNGTTEVIAADVDHDGDLDVVAANSNGDMLKVYWQSSPGVFDPAPSVVGGPMTTDHPFSVEAADVDGDGDLDLVSANIGNDTLTVFWQSSRGVFDPVPAVLGGLAVIGAPVAVEAADIDGDGDLDLVSANAGDNTLTAFRQISPKVFDSTPTALVGFPAINDVFSVEAADIDGDGDVDLAATNLDRLEVFWQSNGEFDRDPLDLIPPAGTVIWIEAADVDGDGDLDLVAAIPVADAVAVFWQSAPGAFDPEPTLVGNVPGIEQPFAVEAADVDADGDLDLVSANTGNQTLAVFSQVGAGVFDPIPRVIDVPVMPRSLVAADLDGDGDCDLVSGGPFGTTVVWQTGRDAFDPAPFVVGSFPLIDLPDCTVATDVDGDGDLDLASANILNDTLTVYWQTSPSAFDPIPAIVGGTPTIDSVVDIAVADVDGDGHLDLVSADGGADALKVFWGGGAGAFGSSPTALGSAQTTAVPWAVHAADVDGDGDLDLASANIGAGTLAVFWQTSARAFDPSPTVLGGSAMINAPEDVAVADVDGDGLNDLVSASGTSDTLVVFWQTNPGTFAPIPTALGGTPGIAGPIAVVAVDVDGDGMPDLASANISSDTLTVFWQEAPRVFGVEPAVVGSSSVIDRPVSLAVADVDMDGDADLVCATDGEPSPDTVTVFRQTTWRTFETKPTIVGTLPSVDDPRNALVADVDGDGDLDFVSSNTGNNTLTVLWGGR